MHVPNPDVEKLKVEDNQNSVKVKVKILPPHLKHIFLDEYHTKKLWFRNGCIQIQKHHK